MKKLLSVAIAAIAIVSSASAVTVYDYKASVKNVNLKKVTMKVDGDSTVVFVKFIQNSSLYGYVVTDCVNCTAGIGNGNGYLVVANKADKAKTPYILPSILTAKAWNPKINPATTWEAEGYLQAGAAFTGDWGSTIKLFGTYNDATYDTAGVPVAFFDTWLAAAGFGKAYNSSTDGGCGVGSSCATLQSLAGSVIGGLYICHPNGYPLNGEYEITLCTGWGGTTDVISGTWSIKRNGTFVGKALVEGETALELTTLSPFVKEAIARINAGASYSTVVAPLIAE